MSQLVGVAWRDLTHLQHEESTKIPTGHRLLTLRPPHFIGSVGDRFRERDGHSLLDFVEEFIPDEVIRVVRFICYLHSSAGRQL